MASETPAERFQRVAAQRVASVLEAMDRLTRLSSADYEYTPEQIDNIAKVMHEAIDDVKEVLINGGKKKRRTFVL